MNLKVSARHCWSNADFGVKINQSCLLFFFSKVERHRYSDFEIWTISHTSTYVAFPSFRCMILRCVLFARTYACNPWETFETNCRCSTATTYYSVSDSTSTRVSVSPSTSTSNTTTTSTAATFSYVYNSLQLILTARRN